MGLIPEFVNNRLNLSVPLLDHFFPDPLLKLLLLVLSLGLVSLHPLLPGNLLLLADPLDLVTLLSLHFRNFFFKLLALFFNLRLSLDNSLLELLLKTVFLSFPLRFKPVVLPIHITLPPEALLVELGLQALILVVKLLLGLFSLGIQSIFLLSSQSLAHVLEFVLLL